MSVIFRTGERPSHNRTLELWEKSISGTLGTLGQKVPNLAFIAQNMQHRSIAVLSGVISEV